MNEIYMPAEDSFLLSDVLEKEVPELIKENNRKNKNSKKEMKILDLGSGSGFQAEILLKLKIQEKNLTLTDINPYALKLLRKKFPKAKILNSCLFQKIRGKFNLIIFNPPYLPEDKKEPLSSRLATTGGKYGSEIINEFLKKAKKYLTEDGKILLLTSSLTKSIDWNSFKKKKMAEAKLFFEKLQVWELTSH